jgi:glycerol uptake facilitator-like aquaporin
MPRLTSVLLAEALGTFPFFFVAMGAVITVSWVQGGDTGGLVTVALAHGLVLAVLRWPSARLPLRPVWASCPAS